MGREVRLAVLIAAALLAGCSSPSWWEEGEPTKVQVLASRPKEAVFLDGTPEHEARVTVFFLSGAGDLIEADRDMTTRVWCGIELAPKPGEWATGFVRAGPREYPVYDGHLPVLGLATGMLVRARTLGFHAERVRIELEARFLREGATVSRATATLDVLPGFRDCPLVPLDEVVSP